MKKNYNLYIASVISFLLSGILFMVWLDLGFLGGRYGFPIAIIIIVFFVLGILLFFGGLARNSK